MRIIHEERREEIQIERRGGPDDRGPGGEDRSGPRGGAGGPNRGRMPENDGPRGRDVEIRVEGRKLENPSQNSTDPRLERILNMVERMNERLDSLERRAGEGSGPADRPSDAPPRDWQGGRPGGGRGGPGGEGPGR